MERFVHETGTGISCHQHTDTLFDFLVVLTGESFHHDAHGPHHIVSDMRSSNAFTRLSSEEIRIVLAPDKAACILIDGIVDIDISQIGQSQQAGNIGIVHQHAAAITVYLVSIDCTIFRMLAGGIFFQSLLYFIGQIRALTCQFPILVHFRQNLGRFPQRSHGKEVGRNEERQGRSIVRRAENGDYQANRIGRGSPTVVDGSIGSTFGFALETVRSPILLTLLFLKGAEYVTDSLQPVFIENTGIARHFPIVIGKPQRIA